ncbi:methyltransferase domain-containing protein [Haloarcula sp. S1CR25-12]|uniref:Methyltransferase domain-containing protein n=1 Tax=Haloarcula saliterrae TaxID=2950534 RepID=A0ABU2F6J0_9EURY|nr:methyltransferase domain-containing protein [Haloarcula sp. S1CR25-12]MDS0257816.1 methyltransferase domain-containing protein [Haloarcula sp. S1CR25-12]
MSGQFYERWASLYDRVARVPLLRSWRAGAVDALDLAPGDTAVEMGCGTGANVPELRERVGPSGRVVGLDITREMLRAARRHAERTGPGVDYLRADATRPPVRGVDAVLGSFVAGVFPDPAAAVDSWCDCVVPGGRVALLNFQRSGRPVAAPLDLAFEGFVRLSAPGTRLSTRSHADSFEQRVAAARRRLTERTVDRRYETFGGGYLGLVSGTVPATDG